MPMLGADMEAGTLIEWLKHPGDAVARGDIIAVVDTQKGAIEIEVFEDGMIDKVLVEPGTEVPVGTPLAVIRLRRGDDGRAAGRAGSAPAANQSARRPSRKPPPCPQRPPRGTRNAHACALRRRRASSHANAASISCRSTAPGPRARLPARTSRPSAASSAPPVTGQVTALDRTAAMRSAIAAAMARSKREIPHYYLSTTVDMSAAVAWLRVENEKRSVTDRLLPVSLLIKAVALALREVPELNGYWTDGAFRAGTGIHVGCAIALRGGGLVAPALHDTDHQDLGTLTRQIRDLVARARAGSLRSSELSDSTITVTNLGDRGVDATFGVIYPPQVALVGFGRIDDRAIVIDGKIEARPIVTVTLSADHRATDGHEGGLFLMAIDRRLQQPETL